jgi:two-component system, OmpR family, response regulator
LRRRDVSAFVEGRNATDIPPMSNNPLHILVVDDEAAIRSILRDGFAREGFTVSEACDKPSLMAKLETEPVNLITLDLGLGREDGLELARQIRSRRNIPIIMITVKGALEDRILGLEHGADDYIAKPFHMREVLLRVRNVLARYAPLGTEPFRDVGLDDNERYRFETGAIDIPRREVRALDGKAIELTDAEFALLTILVRRPNRILSRDELMQLVKGKNWSPLDRSLDVHITHLRKKIEPPGLEAPKLIKSVRGVGYVFTGNVHRA